LESDGLGRNDDSGGVGDKASPKPADKLPSVFFSVVYISASVSSGADSRFLSK
jgi:hypothetical protein